jgi:hypothetical protein
LKIGNLISNDPIVAAVFESVVSVEGLPEEKLKAIIRAGKIAEAFICGSTTAFNSVVQVLGKKLVALFHQNYDPLIVHPSANVVRDHQDNLIAF